MPTTLDEALNQVQSAPALDPLEAAVDAAAQATQAKQELRASVAGAVQQNPDEYAQAKQLAATTGVPAPVIARNLPEAKTRAQISEFDAYLDTSPKLAKSLSNREFANVAHDDTQNLAQLEDIIAKEFAPGWRPSAQPKPTFSNYFRGVWTNVVEGGKQAKLGIEMQVADLLDDGSIESQVYKADKARQFEQSRAVLQDAAPGFKTKGAQAVYGGVTSTARAIPGLGLSILTRSPAPALTTIGTQTEAEAYGKYRTRGATPGESLVGAAGEGAVEVGTELLPMGFLVKRFGKSAAAEFLGGLLARELPSEQAATLAQDAIDTAIANPDKTWGEYLAERPDAAYQTAIATIVQSGIIGGSNFAVAQLADAQAKVDQTQVDAEALQRIFALAEASKVRERDPAAFEQFINEAAKGGPVENLHIDAQALAQSGVDIEALAQASPAAAEQLAEALATGGDIVMPVGEYAARIVGTPLDAKLQPHLRTSEDALSQSEAETFLQSETKAFQATAEKVMAEKAADDVFTQSAAKVESDVLAQLEGVKRFTSDVNKAYANLIRDFYVTTAARLKLTPEQAYARYPVKFRSELENADQPGFDEKLGQGAQQTTSPEFKAWFGDSKVVDEKGTPLVVYHGTNASFDVFDSEHSREGDGIIFATPNKAIASDFALFRSTWQGANVMPLHVKADKVLTIEGGGRLIRDVENSTKITGMKYGETVRDFAAREGYDAIHFRDVRDPVGPDIQPPADVWGFFPSAKIKSAIGNSGAFDPNDPSILKQEANDGTSTDRPNVHAEQNAVTVGGGTPRDGWAQATRVRRTDGKPASVYRGATRELSAADFERGSLGHAKNHPSSALGVWFSAHREEAEAHGAVEVFNLDIRRPKVFKVEDLPGFESSEEAFAFREQLRAEGFDGIAVDARHLGGPIHFVAFDADTVIRPPAAKPLDVGQFFQVTPEQARDTNVETKLPDDPTFSQAVMNTPGAEITDEGLMIRTVRFQKPEQEGARAIRTGVFYLPASSKNARYYRQKPGTDNKLQTYGGEEKFEAPTLIRKPIFVKGATGGKAPEAAYIELKGKEAFKNLESDVMEVVAAQRWMRQQDPAAFDELLTRFLKEHGEPNFAYDIVGASRQGNTLRYALQEHAIAHAVRKAGFDAVVGYSKGKTGPFLSEIFDVREQTYPSHVLSAEIHQDFERSLSQDAAKQSGPITETPAFKAWSGGAPVVSANAAGKTFETGAPVVLEAFHGSRDAGFDVFDTEGRGKTAGTGAFFTDTHLNAQTYSNTRKDANITEDFSPGSGERGNYHVYLRMSDPYVVDAEGRNWDQIGASEEWFAVDVETGETLEYFTNEEDAKHFRDTHDGEVSLRKEHSPGTGMSTDDLVREAKRMGHDGVIFQNVGDEGPSGQGYQWGNHTYVVFDPAQIKSATQNSGAFDPNNPSILGQDTQQSGARGSLTVPADITQTTPIITLFKNADLSTLLHELGHFQLEVLAHIAQQPDAPAEIVADMAAFLKWAGVDSLEAWSKLTLDQKRPYHEKFARGFEAYLFEGKAPNTELRSLFQRFRAWMVAVYRSIKALNVDLNDEIRGVFDRLVATDESIKAAEAARGMEALLPDPEAREAAQEATETAREELTKRSLREMRWLTRARGRALKMAQAEAKVKRDQVEKEVEAEIRQIPVYAAQRFIRYGELPTGEKVTGAKLDIDAMKAMYGEGPAAPWRYLSTGKAGLAGSQGLPPDTLAEMFGFTSGDQLVRELLAAEPEADVVEALTARRALERYGDLQSPEAIAQAADEAVHNEARARFVAAELKALTKASGPVRTITTAAKAFAEATIGRKRVRDIKPNTHAVAEARAARAAGEALAAGKLEEAATAKRTQLVQNISTRLAYDALREIDRTIRYLKKFTSESTRKGLDREYLDQIDQLLERYDLKAVSVKETEKRKSLLAWLESQREQGFEPDVPAELIEQANKIPYRELTLEALRGLKDTIKQIEHLGRLKSKLLTAANEREFTATRDAIAASIEKHAQSVRENRTRNTTGAMLADAGNKFLAAHRKMASLAREMDGFEDNGPVWEYFIRSMNKAGDAETTRRAAATKKLYAMVKPLLTQSMGGKGVYFPSLNASFNREERIAIALNMGNAGNMQRLLDGEGWTIEQLAPLLASITAEEADFVQAVWDFFEEYRPEIGAKEERVYGKQPDWVEPTPVALGGKTLRGGYYPIKYDTARSGRAEQHAEADAAKAQMRGAYTSATTRRSFTKARAQEVLGRPLLYSFAGLYQGTNEVIHDLSWHEWLIDANRLLRSLDGVIRSHYGPEGVRVFKKAIEDIAAGDVPAQNVFERGINHIRTGATIAGLGWNLTTSLLQPLGLTQSMVRVGPGWVAKGIGSWMKAPLETVNFIYEKSDMMKLRGQTMQREINEIQNQVRGDKVGPVKATFFTLIQKMQLVADIPTWMGQYEKSIAAGESEVRAAELADQAVLDAQGGGQVKDLAEIQRGGPALKLFTNFYSFFNVAYNLGAEKTKQKIRDPKQYPSLVLDYLLLYSVPATLGALLKHALTGGDDDDLAKKVAAENLGYLLGLMVGLRELTAATQKVAGVDQFNTSYAGPAGLRLFQEIDKLATQIKQGDIDAALLKAANNVAGIVFHYPSGQINRSAEGAAALIEGDTQNPMALLTGPPK